MVGRLPFTMLMLLLITVGEGNALAHHNHTGAHDPSSIIKSGDTCWIFTTGSGIYAMYSKDLVFRTTGKTHFTPGTYPARDEYNVWYRARTDAAMLKDVPCLDVSAVYDEGEIIINVVNRNKDKAINTDIICQSGEFTGERVRLKIEPGKTRDP